MPNDYDNGLCPCCVCRHKFCMIYHPGHDHNYPNIWLDEVEELDKILEEANKMEESKDVKTKSK